MEKKQSEFEIQDIPHLRDFFASSAMAMVSSSTILYQETPEWVAQKCYQLADAMLKERDADPKSGRNLS